MKIYLVRCNGAKKKQINICITNNIAHAKNLCNMYKERRATYKQITDIQAIYIMKNDFGCQNAIF